ncbi:MAG TPA: glycosyltransferase [Isosphaeraceae bacterium]|nr:glycosyltransferase [Isosphaeraceae bacterium]
MSRTTIVVPCYNEALRLDVRKFEEFSRENRHQRFLFVNDGSTDGTLEVLDDLRRSDLECFALCDLPENVGKAEAVRQGLLRAFEADPDYVGYWDADLATPLDAILTFCSVLDSRPDIDMVFGARVKLLGRCVQRNPLRHYLGRIFATAASSALGVGFYDTQCGAKLFRASHEIRSLFQRPFSTRWIFDVEIIARLIASRRGTDRPKIDEVVYEFPLHEWHDVAGSKVRPGDFARAFYELAAISWRYGRLAGPSNEPCASPIPGRSHAGRIPAQAPFPSAR